MAKYALENYTRDANGTLRSTLVDAETGKPVSKNDKSYKVISQTDYDIYKLTGKLPGGTTDDTNKKQKVNDKTTQPKAPLTYTERQNQRGEKNDGRSFGGSKGSSAGNTVSNNFGYTRKPAAMGLANLIPGLGGMAGRLINAGWNAKNMAAANKARAFEGLPPLSNMDFAKGVIMGEDGMVTKPDENVSVGNQKYSSSFGGLTPQGQTTLTPLETQQRRSTSLAQAIKKDVATQATANSKAKLHEELGPAVTPNKTKTASPISIESTAGLKNNLGTRSADSIRGITVHHTGPYGKSATSIVNGLNDRGLGAHYVVDREGKIHQIADPTTEVAHMKPDTPGAPKAKAGTGDTNANMIGIEVMAKDDSDVTPAQIEATMGLIDHLESTYPSIDPGNVVGHGMVNTHKQAKEGYTIAENAFFGGVPTHNTPQNTVPQDRPGTVAQGIIDQAKTPTGVGGKQGFFQQQYQYARDAGLTGFMADLAVSQAALESGYGTSELASTGNNFHGLKAKNTWTGPTMDVQDDEVGPSSFEVYSNPVESYKSWKTRMEQNYPDVVKATDLPSAIEGLKNGTLGMYASSLANPDPKQNYATKLGQAYAALQDSGMTADRINQVSSDFGKYSLGYYTKAATATFAKDAFDAAMKSTPPQSFGANRPATIGQVNLGATNPSQMGGVGMGSGFGKSTSPTSVGHVSPGATNPSQMGGVGMGNSFSGHTSTSPGHTSTSPSNPSQMSGTGMSSGLGNANKDKNKDNEGATGSYGLGSFGGPR